MSENYDEPNFETGEPNFDDEPGQYEEKKPTISIASDIKKEIHTVTSDVEIVRKGITLSKIREIYSKRYGRELSDEQLAGLFETAQMLEIREDDGIWLILLVFENYSRLFAEAPWNIIVATRQLIQEFRDEMEAGKVRALAEYKAEIAKMMRQQKKARQDNVFLVTIVILSVFTVFSTIVSFLTLKIVLLNGGYKASFPFFLDAILRFLQ